MNNEKFPYGPNYTELQFREGKTGESNFWARYYFDAFCRLRGYQPRSEGKLFISYQKKEEKRDGI